MRFVWKGGQSELGEALQLVVVRWNQLVDATETRTPLKIEITPLESDAGWRLTIDLVKGLGLPATEDLVALLTRYYGPEGKLVIDVAPIDNGQWLATTLPPDQRAVVERTSGDTPHPDEILANRRTETGPLDQLERTGRSGRPREHDRPPREAADEGGAGRTPANRDGRRLAMRIEARLPLTTYESLVGPMAVGVAPPRHRGRPDRRSYCVRKP